jgi:hypothetical protein
MNLITKVYMNLKVFRIIIVILISTLAFSGCHPYSAKYGIKVSKRSQNPWTKLRTTVSAEDFTFAVVGDRTGGMRPGVFEEAVQKLNILQPHFVMSVGDFVEGKTENIDTISQQWTEFEIIVNRLEMPFFFVPGNHDISNPVMQAEWDLRFGCSYYYFLYRDVLFMVLNSEDSIPSHFSQKQIQMVSRTLLENQNVRWTFIFFHKPLWLNEENTGWEKIEGLLSIQNYTVFAGHLHQYKKYQRDNHNYYQLATTGGKSDLSGMDVGRFDHIVWVTMGSDTPRVALLKLDGIIEDNIRVESISNKY